MLAIYCGTLLEENKRNPRWSDHQMTDEKTKMNFHTMAHYFRNWTLFLWQSWYGGRFAAACKPRCILRWHSFITFLFYNNGLVLDFKSKVISGKYRYACFKVLDLWHKSSKNAIILSFLKDKASLHPLFYVANAVLSFAPPCFSCLFEATFNKFI